MTDQELRTLISLAIPKDAAQADTIAGVALSMAIKKIGRMPNVSWNRDAVTFSLTSGTSTYELGSDIIAQYPEIWNLQHLWRTDTQGAPVPIKSIEEFNSYARGSSSTGAPQIAMLHSYNKTLEIYPEPDSTYTLWAYVRRQIDNLEDIPDAYHDAVGQYAIMCVHAINNPTLATALAKEGFMEIQGDALNAFTGNKVGLDRHVGGVTTNVAYVDSQNLRGD